MSALTEETSIDRAGPPRCTILVFLFTLSASAIFLGIVFFAPILRNIAFERSAAVLYKVFSPLCHQIPDRCLTFKGFPLPICGRCLGIYAGFLFGATLYPFVKGFKRLSLPPAHLFVFFTLPLAVDGIAGLLSLWTTPVALRFATGFIWGSLLPYYFVPGVAMAILEWKSRKSG